jgi:hypothetical protein
MPHKRLWSFWTTSLALAIVTLTILAVGNAQESLQPYAPSILHTFLDSANVYPRERDGGSVERDFRVRYLSPGGTGNR